MNQALDVWHRLDRIDDGYAVFVAGGFAEVSNNRLTVLTENAVALDEIKRADADARLAEAREAVGDASDDRGRANAEKQLAIAEALVVAVAE